MDGLRILLDGSTELSRFVSWLGRWATRVALSIVRFKQVVCIDCTQASSRLATLAYPCMVNALALCSLLDPMPFSVTYPPPGFGTSRRARLYLLR